MEPYDLVGVGFGPSNISVAIAADESDADVRVAFFDRKTSFSWHPGLMFAGAEMQVSFTKDLITMRNPRSRYSFLNYLAENGRLGKFINLRTFYPTRVEFNDYYAWVADQFADSVEWGTEVVSVTPAADADSAEGSVDLLRVRLRDVATGHERDVLTRNLVLAPGGETSVPSGVSVGRRVFHAAETLPRLEADFPELSAPYHFNIAGAGQTAADVFLYLRRTYPNARITHCIRGFAIRPEDDTHFVNEFFLPEAPEWFYGRTPEFRSTVLEDYRLAAHTGVSYDLIPQIYREHYEEQVCGGGRLQTHRFTELVEAGETEDRAKARYRQLDTGEELSLDADALILATGYRYTMPIAMLEGVQEYLKMDTPDQYAVRRSYDIESSAEFRPRVFLQGYAEASHGFSEVLLSLMPFRAAEIVAAVGSERRPAGTR
ncbi:lysine N(6)-hydroxylase/L-ornithine N(5)-oxygenase family protein [Streptomyces tendae]|uniref:lysine N(6)-hydroxylase/L-ornithine N(5)-oxygenase family protein n=1 Tax=Streptomyces tendae TaxID=1932 RepID=UPI0024912283|nr:SidA/IucD/PvdA family monooxygenase [Streptomyces tendae]